MCVSREVFCEDYFFNNITSGSSIYTGQKHEGTNQSKEGGRNPSTKCEKNTKKVGVRAGVGVRVRVRLWARVRVKVRVRVRVRVRLWGWS